MQDARQTRRVRLRPGPLLAVTLAWLATAPALLRAHDPGLSVLEIDARRRMISATLSVADADATSHAGALGTDSRTAIAELAREAVRLTVNGETLVPIVEDTSIEDGGVRVRMTFAVDATSRTRRLLVTSDVPRRLARGHRQLAVVATGDGDAIQKVLDAGSDAMAVDLDARSGQSGTAWSFLALGNHHILSGADHLLFLVGLILTAVTVRDLVVLLTTFTIAHSISLALVVLGVQLPSSIVEPLIAASIAWVGLEILLGVQNRRRWLVTLGFGLMHGFGFAGALTEVGVGATAIEMATALFFFNAGVETGQLVVAAVIVPIVWALRSRPVWQATIRPICALLVAIAGGYWLVERLV